MRPGGGRLLGPAAPGEARQVHTGPAGRVSSRPVLWCFSQDSLKRVGIESDVSSAGQQSDSVIPLFTPSPRRFTPACRAAPCSSSEGRFPRSSPHAAPRPVLREPHGSAGVSEQPSERRARQETFCGRNPFMGILAEAKPSNRRRLDQGCGRCDAGDVLSWRNVYVSMARWSHSSALLSGRVGLCTSSERLGGAPRAQQAEDPRCPCCGWSLLSGPGISACLGGGPPRRRKWMCSVFCKLCFGKAV